MKHANDTVFPKATSSYLNKIVTEQNSICDSYIVFIDISSYTQRKTSVKQLPLITSLQDMLNRALLATKREFGEQLERLGADLPDDLIVIPLGDGAAIAFPFPSLIEIPLFFSRRLYEIVQTENIECSFFKKNNWCECHNNIILRCGISFGSAIIFNDINGNLNIAGTPVNLAARLMGVCSPGQIFVCDNYFKRRNDLIKGGGKGFRSYVAEIKHGLKIDAHQLSERAAGVNTKVRSDLEKVSQGSARPSSAKQPKKIRASSSPELDPAEPPQPSAPAAPQNTIFDNLVLVPAGSFQLQNPSEPKSKAITATISRPLLVSSGPVTQRQYRAIMGKNNSRFEGEENPVDSVSWFEAIDFCNALSLSSGLTPAYDKDGDTVTFDIARDGFRLPTEVEWEHCARWDSQEHGPADTADIAWYSRNASKTTHPIGQRRLPNSPLSDLLGNVWEWCWDQFGPYPKTPIVDFCGAEGSRYRIVRGGSWLDPLQSISCDKRHRVRPKETSHTIGFRIVRNAPLK